MKLQWALLIVLVTITSQCAISAPLSDDSQTIALWHMDSVFTTTSRTWIDDDESSPFSPARDNDLCFGNSSNAASTYPRLTIGNGGYDGEAMVFDGNDMCYTPFKNWAGYDSLRIEFWFKHAGAADQTLMAVNTGTPWELRITGTTTLTFYPWFEYIAGGSAGAKSVARSFTAGAWNHVIATVYNGTISLEINGNYTSRTYDTGTEMLNDASGNYIVMGCKQAGNRYYQGLIDEVKISIPSIPFIYPEQYYPYEDAYGTYMLWHMDETTASSSNLSTIADDDSANPNRGYDLYLMYNTGFVTPESGSGPQLVDSFDSVSEANFCNAISFDGLHDKARVNVQNSNLGVDGSNFKIDAWVKLDDQISTYGSNRRYYIMMHNPRFAVYLVDTESSGWQIHYTCWYSGGGWTLVASYPNHTDWHHISAQWYNGLQKLYVDGELKTSKTNGATTVANGSGYLYLGAYDGIDSSRYFWGMMDEVRISQAVYAAPSCGYWGYYSADFNKDCVVDMADMAVVFEHWLECSIPGQTGCEEF
ncbi:MAG: hypothetical protein A2Y12_01105 [Planctomycetes bacterium GWF2_42_9]|nr:MAG: hypothetical protein A2Y12_01105 [Planctomycetes bacterium GWF2_42_9]